MRRLAALLALGLLAAGSAACSGDDSGTSTTTLAPSTESTDAAGPPETPAGPVPSVPDLMLTAEALPGFAEATDVDDTITTFCAGEDASAGL